MTAFVATTNQNIDDLGFAFVAANTAAATVYYNTTGLAWAASGTAFSAATAWTGYASGDGLEVFVAANRTTATSLNVALASPTSATVRATSLPVGAAWTKCDFGNHVFASICTSTTSAAYRNPRAGTDWTASTLPSAAAWSLLCYGDTGANSGAGTWLAIAPGSTSSAYNTNNASGTWTANALPASLTWSDVKFFNGVFVLVASGSQDVYTSTDGVTWNTYTGVLPSATTWSKLAWAPVGGAQGTWVVVSNNTAAAYSTDNGATWTAATLPASATWLVCGGANNWDGRYMFVALPVSSTIGAFSFDGITWSPITGLTSAAYLDIKVLRPQAQSGDTLTVKNGCTLTVNTDQKRFWLGASAVTLTNGILNIINDSTSTPIRFGTGRLNTTAALHSVTASNGLGKVNVQGAFIQLGTSTGAAGQSFTSPYATGDYIPCLWVETGNATDVYEQWVNVTGMRSYDNYLYARNGFKSVGNGEAGKVFTQDGNRSAVQYVRLANCNAIADTNIITCTSTSGLFPGAWITGRGLAATTVVQEIIDSTHFSVNFITPAASSSAVGAGWTNIPMIAVNPVCSQYSTTLRFGDGVNGSIPVNGARIKIPNILLTDYTPAVFQTSAYSSTNAPCNFTTPAGGVFVFDTCLFGESYSICAQSGQWSMNNVGACYVPWLSEGYSTTIANAGFSVPPLTQHISNPTALGATGSCTATLTSVTIPSSTAVRPGVLITGTGLHACVVDTVASATSLTVSTAAHTNSSNVAYSYYGNWTLRDHRWNTAVTATAGASFHSAAWTLMSGLTLTNVVMTHCGHAINGANTNPALGGPTAGSINLQYSNNVTVNGLKVIAVGSAPKNRANVTALSPNVAGANHNYSNIKLYNMSGVLGASAVTSLALSNITHATGVVNEGYNWASGHKIFTNPAAGGSFLANDTKYWVKTRSFRSNNWSDSTTYADSFPVCGVMGAPVKYKQMPTKLSAAPNWSTTLAPTLAYGAGKWLALNGLVATGANTVMVSTDNGSTWTNYFLPLASSTMQWWKLQYCPGMLQQANPVVTRATATTAPTTATMLTSTITGYALAIGSVSAGTVTVGMLLTGTGVTAGTYIVSGSGLSWTVSVSQTVASTTITGTNNAVTVGSTTGMTVGSPITFVGTAIGNLVSATTYYVSSIISGTQLNISATYLGTTNFTQSTAAAAFASVTTASITGTILTCTRSAGTIAVGQLLSGGTVAANTYIVANLTGSATSGISTWVVSVSQSATGITTATASMTCACNGNNYLTATSATGNYASLSSNASVAVGDELVFSSALGGLSANVSYFVTAKNGSTDITVSTTRGGSDVTLSNATPATPYACLVKESYFVAIGGGTIATTMLSYSKNGADWSIPTTAPASALWQATAYDKTMPATPLVAVSGGNAVSTASMYVPSAGSTNGSVVCTAGGALASAQWIDVASNGAGRFVAIAGGTANGTASSYSTVPSTWTAGGALASSLWQSIAYGNGTFCAVSATNTTGPTSCSADAVAWTAGTAPALPTGMVYNKIIYTGSVFVLLAGPTPLSTAAPSMATASSCYVISTSNTSTSVTWSALKYLPDVAPWIAMTNNGNAVGFISTQTGQFCYTADITQATPTFVLSSLALPVWNRISAYSQSQEFTTAMVGLTAVQIAQGSSAVTCASTGMLQVGHVIVLSSNTVFSGAMYLGSGAIATETGAAIVTSIDSPFHFTINKPAARFVTGLTATVYKHAYQLFRSTTSGFTARDETTLIGTTPTAGGVGNLLFDDSFGVVAGTPYYYRLRKLSGGGAVTITAYGGVGEYTIQCVPSVNFYRWQTSREIRGVTGENFLTSLFFNFFSAGIVPGCIVTGTGIPAGTTVIDVPDFDTIILSANLTSDVNDRGNNRTWVWFSPAPGMYVYGGCVGQDAVIESIDSATQITLSVANTASFGAQALRFVFGEEFPEIASIPAVPQVVVNLALQSSTLGTTWVASNITATNAAMLGPIDNFLHINAAAPAATGCSLLAGAANGTLTQTINTGVGSAYTFSLFARADLADNRDYQQMTLSLGTATNTVYLTNQWTRYSVTFTATAGTTNAVITLLSRATLAYVQHAMVTLGSSPPVPITATTTTPLYLATQQMFNPALGLAGWFMDEGAGLETTLNAAPAGQHYAHCHIGTTSDFTISDQNQVFSTETPGTDQVFGVTTSTSNVEVDNYQPLNTFIPGHQILLNALLGSTGITIKNSSHAINGTAGNLFTIPAATPAYNIYLHNIDVYNIKSYIAGAYFEGTSANSSGNVRVQNVRSNRVSRAAWNLQTLNMSLKGVAGVNTYPAYNATTWSLATTLTQDSVPLVNTSVFDSMFHEFTWGALGKGCLDIRMIASTAAVKPYTITGGAPYFSNDGSLFFQTVSDQVEITWPHDIKGVTGFSRRRPHIYGTDIGLDIFEAPGVLVEYDLNKGSGYSGTWKKMNGPTGMKNLSDETGISTEGLRIKLRLSARKGLKYTGQTGQFIQGWTIQNAISNPTATAVVADDVLYGAATTGTVIVENASLTGEWTTGNTIYSGTLQTTVSASTAQTTATLTDSTISGTTLTVGTLSAGTIGVGMLLTGGTVLSGTHIVSNISGSGSGSTWVVSLPQNLLTTTLTGTLNSITCSTTVNMWSGAAMVFATTFSTVTAGTTYYVNAIIDGTHFTLTTAFLGNTSPVLTTTAISSQGAGIHGTITATNGQVWFPQPTSKLTAIRIFTEVNMATLYAYASVPISITDLRPDSEVRIYRTDTEAEIAGTESSGTSFTTTYDYYEDVNVYVMVLHLDELPIYLPNQVITTEGLSLSIQRQKDRQYDHGSVG